MWGVYVGGCMFIKGGCTCIKALKLKGSPPRHYMVILKLKSLGVAITSESHLCTPCRNLVVMASSLTRAQCILRLTPRRA
jgi:hypothetical protein